MYGKPSNKSYSRIRAGVRARRWRIRVCRSVPYQNKPRRETVLSPTAIRPVRRSSPRQRLTDADEQHGGVDLSSRSGPRRPTRANQLVQCPRVLTTGSPELPSFTTTTLRGIFCLPALPVDGLTVPLSRGHSSLLAKLERGSGKPQRWQPGSISEQEVMTGDCIDRGRMEDAMHRGRSSATPTIHARRQAYESTSRGACMTLDVAQAEGRDVCLRRREQTGDARRITVKISIRPGSSVAETRRIQSTESQRRQHELRSEPGKRSTKGHSNPLRTTSQRDDHDQLPQRHE